MGGTVLENFGLEYMVTLTACYDGTTGKQQKRGLSNTPDVTINLPTNCRTNLFQGGCSGLLHRWGCGRCFEATGSRSGALSSVGTRVYMEGCTKSTAAFCSHIMASSRLLGEGKLRRGDLKSIRWLSDVNHAKRSPA